MPGRILLRRHPRDSLWIWLRHRYLEGDQSVLGLGRQRRKRIILNDAAVIDRSYFSVLALLENVAQHPEHFVGLTVQRIAFGHCQQPSRRRTLVALDII